MENNSGRGGRGGSGRRNRRLCSDLQASFEAPAPWLGLYRPNFNWSNRFPSAKQQPAVAFV
jgi:hypothetical protein